IVLHIHTIPPAPRYTLLPYTTLFRSSGDFDPAEMVAKIDRAFSYMQPREIPSLSTDEEQPITQPIVREVTGPNPEFVTLTYRLRSEEHTSELQSRENLVCRLLLEKKT